MTKSLLLLIISVLQTYGFDITEEGDKLTDCYNDDDLTNGCSIPGKVDFPYEQFFDPACVRHDVCYTCGYKYGFAREDCDEGFRRNMKYLCHLKERSKSPQMLLFSLNFGKLKTFWTELKGTFAVGKDILKWLGLKSGTLEHCLNGVDVYFDAVTHFSMNHFHVDAIKQCNWKCSRTLGNPTIGLNQTDVKEDGTAQVTF